MVRHSAAGGLGYARSDHAIVIPALIQILPTNDHSLMHHAAALLLGLLHEKPEMSVPALMESFSDTNENQKAVTVIAPGYSGPKAKPAAPLLLEALNDKDELVRELAKQALQESPQKH